MSSKPAFVYNDASYPLNHHAKISAGQDKESEGGIQSTNIESFTFNDQYNTYMRSGYAIDALSNEVLGDHDAFVKESNTSRKKEVKVAKRKQFQLEEDDDEDEGPWASDKNLDPVPVGVPKEKVAKVEAEIEAPAEQANMHLIEPDEEDEKWQKKDERKLRGTLPPLPKRGSVIGAATTTFHGKELKDYQGRSWMAAPTNMKPDQFEGEHDCFLPKKCIKKFVGHTKGVQAIEFFPKTGHLLLSASMDSDCKIWDTTDDFKVKRTYSGHTEGVRSIHMSNDGSQFLSSAFDRYVRLWDVETGQAAATFSNRKMNYSVKFNPLDNNVFIAAASDNKIYQWDCRTGQICQEYNYHLQPCNTVTFVDEGRKFVSTSDDKKILVWEYDVPVPIKYIAEPEMHVVSSVTLHPSGQFFAGQSMDNKIVVYTAGEKVKPLKKKIFSGHNNSGYANQIAFSPNGKFLVSGDGHGQMHFWDWKTTKAYRKFQAHDNGPCICTAWHPINPSWVASCGWDGIIKLWD